MKTHVVPQELVGLPGMPSTERNCLTKLNKLVDGHPDMKRRREVGKGFEYHIDCLPAETQRWLRAEQAKRDLAALPKPTEGELIAELAAAQQAIKARKAGAAARTMQMKPEHQKKAVIRAGLVRQYEHFVAAHPGVKKGELMAMFIEQVTSLTLPYAREHAAVIDMTRLNGTTFYRWMKLLREQGADALAIEAKNAQKRVGTSMMDTQPELMEFAIAMMIEYPSANGRMLCRAMKACFGEKYRLPSDGQMGRWMAAWKSKNANALTAMTNPDDWRNKYMVAFGDASEHITALNQLWELDATPADVECVWEGNRKRVHITGVIDVWSRRARMFVTETPRASATAQLVRGAILDWGKPEVCKTDNGSDYVAQRLALTFDNLDILQVLCTPFSPHEKPHIERFFKTFSHDLLELKPGYVGHSVAERKGIESKRSFAKRLMTKGELIEVRMTPDELQAFCDDWLKVYHHRRHAGLQCSPAEQAAAFQGEIERISDERALDMLLAEPVNGGGTRTVSKKGIKIDNIWYVAAELVVGSLVQVYYDERDMGRLVVYSANHEFLCIATAPEYLGVSRRTLALAARKTQNAMLAEAKQLAAQAKRKYNVKEIADQILAHEVEIADELAAALPAPATATVYSNEQLAAARDAREALDGIDAPAVAVSHPELSTEEKEAMLVSLRRAEGIDEDDAEAKWERWLALHQREQSGDALSEFERHWKERYEVTPECKGRRMVHEFNWGPSAVRK